MTYMSRSVTPRMSWKVFSNAPIRSPPTIAPGMLPSPPMTAAMSPFTVTGTVRRGDRIPTDAPTMAPAIPPMTPAMMNVVELVPCTLMPQSWAATGCWATARVAMPSLVR